MSPGTKCPFSEVTRWLWVYGREIKRFFANASVATPSRRFPAGSQPRRAWSWRSGKGQPQYALHLGALSLIPLRRQERSFASSSTVPSSLLRSLPAIVHSQREYVPGASQVGCEQFSGKRRSPVSLFRLKERKEPDIWEFRWYEPNMISRSPIRDRHKPHVTRYEKPISIPYLRQSIGFQSVKCRCSD